MCLVHIITISVLLYMYLNRSFNPDYRPISLGIFVVKFLPRFDTVN